MHSLLTRDKRWQFSEVNYLCASSKSSILQQMFCKNFLNNSIKGIDMDDSNCYCYILQLYVLWMVSCMQINATITQSADNSISYLLAGNSITCLQGPRKIDDWGGGAHIHIFALCIIIFFWNQLFLQSEHEYMNMCPPPIIDLPWPLLHVELIIYVYFYCFTTLVYFSLLGIYNGTIFGFIFCFIFAWNV